jgi:hypothetical protein
MKTVNVKGKYGSELHDIIDDLLIENGHGESSAHDILKLANMKYVKDDKSARLYLDDRMIIAGMAVNVYTSLAIAMTKLGMLEGLDMGDYYQ